jgi:hypothetical protein
MKAFIKHALVFLPLCMSAHVSANEIWVPGTTAGGYLEYVTLNTNQHAIDTLSFPWQEKTRIEYGFISDTTTYFVSAERFDFYKEQSLEIYRTLRDAMFNKIPVNVQVDSDTRDFLQIRLGASSHPLALWRPSQGGSKGAEDGALRIDLLGRTRKSASSLSWQGTVPARFKSC